MKSAYEDYFTVEQDTYFMTHEDTIIRKIGFFLVPCIFIYGIYILLNGQVSPGGGFSGGAILGAGMIIFTSAYGFDKVDKYFTLKLSGFVTFAALSFYSFAKGYVFFMGANGLENHIPKGTPGVILSGGMILPLDIAVGLVVACTMYGFYSLFRRGSIGGYMIKVLLINYEEAVAIILFGIGLTMLLFHRNLIKKLIGMNIMDTGVFLFLASMGYIEGRKAPIITDGIQNVEAYINPVPAGLVLTGIVVSVSVTAVMLSLSIRLYKRYHTLDLDDVYLLSRHQTEDR